MFYVSSLVTRVLLIMKKLYDSKEATQQATQQAIEEERNKRKLHIVKATIIGFRARWSRI